MEKNDKKDYNRKYVREHTYPVCFRLSREKDRELIEKYLRIKDKVAWFRKALENS